MTILEALEKTNNINKLAFYTGIKIPALKNRLRDLIKEGKVYHNKRFNKYHLILEGTLSLKNDFFGFIIPNEEGKDDIYVSIKNILDARDGDTVNYYTYEDYYKGSLKEYADVIKVVSRNKKELVGIVKVKKTKKGTEYYLIPTDESIDMKPSLLLSESEVVLPGQIVRASLHYNGSKIKASLIEIIGNIDDPGIEISTIAATYGFALDFPIEVKEEVSHIKQSLEPKDYVGRKDFRDLKIITIDGDDSKDFDDAVNVRRLSNGNYLLGVYIADVSSYVKFNTPLDNEAFKRGTSVYLADRVIPMLPHELSNGICSLNEGVDRQVLAITMEINKNGKCESYEINDGIINSCHRMTYNLVNQMLKGNKEVIDKYSDIYEMILEMNELHKILRNKRESLGGLEFEADEYKFTLNPDGSPKSISLRIRDEAEKIIEDFMIKANEMVAYHMSISELPALYRVHENPDQDKLRQVFNLITNMGVKLEKSNHDINPHQVQKALEDIKDSPKEAILNQLLLRSMMKAKYQPENIGHYGLALKFYAHFTSPIRRYPDLILHRIIKELIIHPEDFKRDYNYYVENLMEIGLKTSASERRAIECERTVDDMLYAWFMEANINKIYKGVITSITGFGMFVAIDNGVEGLVHIRTMQDDYYTFDEKNLELVSPKKTYRLGDMVDVLVIASDRNTRKIDFMLVDNAKEVVLLDEDSSN